MMMMMMMNKMEKHCSQLGLRKDNVIVANAISQK